MFSQSKLADKFTLLLSIVFISAIALSGLVLSNVLEHRAEAEVSYQNQVLAEMVNSVRSYTSNRISPLLMPKIESESIFTPEAIPSFAAREIFETFRKNPDFKNLFYKDAALNPTNTRDQADEFETDLIDRFRSESHLKTLSGFRKIGGETLFYSARPFSIQTASCLRCHSTPKVAPPSQLASYGSEHGFGWKLNEILGTQIVYVPATQLFGSVHQASMLFISIFVGIFAFVILLINYLLKRNVIQPIKPLAQLARRMSTAPLSADEAEFERQNLGSIVHRKDELGQLGKVFQTMMYEIYIREQQLKQQIQKLRVEIDQEQRIKQVAEIEESETFQKIQQEAQELRNKWRSTNHV